MKKKIIFPIVILVVALIGVGAYLMFGKNLGKVGMVSNEKSGTPKTLKDILGLGTAQKCTYPGGTLYVASGKVRGDFVSVEGENQIKGHMIVNGNTSYIWTDDSKTGFKTTFDATTASTPSSSEVQKTEGINPVQPEDYNCEGWIVNQELFNLPSGVTFSDINDLIPSGVPTSTNSDSGSQCSYCDALSGEQKAQCLSAMNCE